MAQTFAFIIEKDDAVVLSNALTTWLDDHHSCDITDIKYQVGTITYTPEHGGVDSVMWYSVLIIYTS